MHGARRRQQATAQVVELTGINEPMIERLVHEFYRRVQMDAMLAPIFAGHIADWPPHLERMCAFWSSVVLFSGRYHGRPMDMHQSLPLNAGHFERWLNLFRETAYDICPPVAAEHFIDRANRVADSLLQGIERHTGAQAGIAEFGVNGRSAMNRNKDIPECSSPPCYLHEIDPAYAGLDMKPEKSPAKRKAATRKVKPSSAKPKESHKS